MAATHVSSSNVRAATHARVMNENVIVTTFSEDSRAYEALARLKELAVDGQIDLHDGAVVARAQDGTLHLHDEAGNEDEGLATLTGGTIGLLIGILAGPLGVLLGGAMGVLAGAIVDSEDDDETDSVLEHMARSIGNGQTAVLVDLDESDPAAVDAAMAALDGRVSRYVRTDGGAEIAGAEEAAHEARVTARKELRHQRREATVEKVQAKLHELRERLRHLVHRGGACPISRFAVGSSRRWPTPRTSTSPRSPCSAVTTETSCSGAASST